MIVLASKAKGKSEKGGPTLALEYLAHLSCQQIGVNWI